MKVVVLCVQLQVEALFFFVFFFAANHSPHGHAASVWTEDLTLALETAKRCVGQLVQSREVDAVLFLLAADNVLTRD